MREKGLLISNSAMEVVMMPVQNKGRVSKTLNYRRHMYRALLKNGPQVP